MEVNLLTTVSSVEDGRKDLIDLGLAVVNLCATAFGAGLLSIPFSMKLSGLIPGLVLLTALCALSAYTTYILSRACRISGQTSYDSCLGYFFGARMQVLGKLTIMLCLLIIAVSYLVALVDLIDAVISRFQEYDQEGFRPIQLALIILVTFPLTLVKRLSALGFVSWVAVVSCFFIAFSLLGIYAKASSEDTIVPGAKLFDFSGNIFYVLPLQAFNFAYHYIWYETVNEVSNRTERNIKKLGGYSQGIIFVCYVTAGIFGYLTYGPETQGDIFANQDPKNNVVIVGRMAAIFTLLFSFPLLVVPLRDHCISLARLRRNLRGMLMVSLGLSSVLYLCANFLRNIAMANAVAGTITSLVVYIYPGAMLTQMNDKHWKSRLEGGLIIIVGVVVSASGIAFAIDGPK